jgi:hypothetical protein
MFFLVFIAVEGFVYLKTLAFISQMQDGPINVCNEDGTRIEG